MILGSPGIGSILRSLGILNRLRIIRSILGIHNSLSGSSILSLLLSGNSIGCLLSQGIISLLLDGGSGG